MRTWWTPINHWVVWAKNLNVKLRWFFDTDRYEKWFAVDLWMKCMQCVKQLWGLEVTKIGICVWCVIPKIGEFNREIMILLNLQGYLGKIMHQASNIAFLDAFDYQITNVQIDGISRPDFYFKYCENLASMMTGPYSSSCLLKCYQFVNIRERISKCI